MVPSDSQAPVGWQDIEAWWVSHSFSAGAASHYVQRFTSGRGIEDYASEISPEPVDKEAEIWREGPRVIPG